jgi:hypothetical protein
VDNHHAACHHAQCQGALELKILGLQCGLRQDCKSFANDLESLVAFLLMPWFSPKLGFRSQEVMSQNTTNTTQSCHKRIRLLVHVRNSRRRGLMAALSSAWLVNMSMQLSVHGRAQPYRTRFLPDQPCRNEPVMDYCAEIVSRSFGAVAPPGLNHLISPPK